MGTTPEVESLIKKTKIYQVTNPRLVHAPSSISIRQAIQIMQENRSSYIVIEDQNILKGIFTATDVATRVLGHVIDWERPVAEVMTTNPVTLHYTDTVEQAMEYMAKYRCDHIPLIHEGSKNELAGVLSVRSLIRFLAEFYPTEVLNLPPDPNQVMKTPEGG
jgi:CBS domain-containing protein